jgi:hypothetical protein
MGNSSATQASEDENSMSSSDWGSDYKAGSPLDKEQPVVARAMPSRMIRPGHDDVLGEQSEPNRSIAIVMAHHDDDNGVNDHYIAFDGESSESPEAAFPSSSNTKDKENPSMTMMMTTMTRSTPSRNKRSFISSPSSSSSSPRNDETPKRSNVSSATKTTMDPDDDDDDDNDDSMIATMILYPPTIAAEPPRLPPTTTTTRPATTKTLDDTVPTTGRVTPDETTAMDESSSGTSTSTTTTMTTTHKNDITAVHEIVTVLPRMVARSRLPFKKRFKAPRSTVAAATAANDDDAPPPTSPRQASFSNDGSSNVLVSFQPTTTTRAILVDYHSTIPPIDINETTKRMEANLKPPATVEQPSLASSDDEMLSYSPIATAEEEEAIGLSPWLWTAQAVPTKRQRRSVTFNMAILAEAANNIAEASSSSAKDDNEVVIVEPMDVIMGSRHFTANHAIPGNRCLMDLCYQYRCRYFSSGGDHLLDLVGRHQKDVILRLVGDLIGPKHARFISASTMERMPVDEVTTAVEALMNLLPRPNDVVFLPFPTERFPNALVVAPELFTVMLSGYYLLQPSTARCVKDIHHMRTYAPLRFFLASVDDALLFQEVDETFGGLVQV